MKYVFRILEDGARWYFNEDGNWTGDAREAYVFATLDEARREMRELRSLDESMGARIVRVLNRDEMRRKDQAEALRRLAAWCHERSVARRRVALDWAGESAHDSDAEAAESMADALWPQKRKAAGR